MNAADSFTADTIEASVVRFCRLLRDNGLLVAAAESCDAVRMLALLDIGDRDDVYLALRSLMASNREDLTLFERLFTEFWSVRQPATSDIPRPSLTRKVKPAPPSSFSMQGWLRSAHGNLDIIETKSASASTLATPGAIGQFDTSELRSIATVARDVARRLANRPGRRWQPARRGARLDLRRSLRNALGTGGDIAQLARRRRRVRRLRVVAVCDVSGSMDIYSRFFLQFLFALHQSRARVESFVFATRLTRVTDFLTRDALNDAVDALAEGVRDWSGGTRIGESMAFLDARWGRMIDRHTVVVVLSDGWDTGEPALLDRALGQIARQSRRVIWLNPLLGSPGYRPATRGLEAALPHVDVFAPLHDLDSLRRLGRLIAP